MRETRKMPKAESLRSGLIRLAYANPKTRKHILPLVRTSAYSKDVPKSSKDNPITEGEWEVSEGTHYFAGKSRVRARGSSVVESSENAVVELRDNAKATARGHSLVNARGKSSVVAYGDTTVVGYNDAKVEAHDRVKVEAYDKVSVKSDDAKRVKLYDDAKVSSHGKSNDGADEKSFEESVKGKKFKNTETGNEVLFSSLPSDQQSKIRDSYSKKASGYPHR